MKYRDAEADLKGQRKVLVAMFFTMTVFAAWGFWGWSQATRELPAMHIAPDLSQGMVIRPGEVPEPNVYAFALYVWQQINRWAENGKADYPAAIFRFSAYLTPRFREELLEDMRRRGLSGELDERVRGVQEIPGHHYAFNRVDIKRKNSVWVVWLDLTVEEHYRKTLVKKTHIRYPVRVVRMAVDKALNPFGLALDGYANRDGPRRLTADELAVTENPS